MDVGCGTRAWRENERYPAAEGRRWLSLFWIFFFFIFAAHLGSSRMDERRAQQQAISTVSDRKNLRSIELDFPKVCWRIRKSCDVRCLSVILLADQIASKLPGWRIKPC